MTCRGSPPACARSTASHAPTPGPAGAMRRRSGWMRRSASAEKWAPATAALASPAWSLSWWPSKQSPRRRSGHLRRNLCARACAQEPGAPPPPSPLAGVQTRSPFPPTPRTCPRSKRIACSCYWTLCPRSWAPAWYGEGSQVCAAAHAAAPQPRRHPSLRRRSGRWDRGGAHRPVVCRRRCLPPPLRWVAPPGTVAPPLVATPPRLPLPCCALAAVNG